MISCGREGWKIEEKNLQVSVWRVAAVQKVRANNPHSTLDSLVARFRQLRPDLVRISRVSAEGHVSDLPNQVPQHTAPQAKNAKQGSTSLHKRFHKVCHLFQITASSALRFKVWEDRVDMRRSTLEASGIWSSGQHVAAVQAHKKSTLKTLLPSVAPLTLR